MAAETEVWIVTTDGKTDQSSFLIARSEGEGILERRADRKPNQVHELWCERISDDEDINEVLDAWTPRGEPVARSGRTADFPEQYFRTTDGRLGFWDPIASALARQRTFHVMGIGNESGDTATPDERDLTPIEHHPVYVVLLEHGPHRSVSNHPTENIARDVYSSHFLGGTYDRHLRMLTEMLVPIVSTSDHEQREFEAAFTHHGYYPDWARATLTWASFPYKVPRANYPARIIGQPVAGWVDRDAPSRPDGKVPVYLGDRVRWEKPTDLATHTLPVFALNWADSEGDGYPFGDMALSADDIKLTAPQGPTVDCRKLELREWRVPGISALDLDGERVAAEFIARGLLHGTGGDILDWYHWRAAD